jgi:catechol 2,3-dioxygenase-like lactoylglutathione lyase family enzyme
VGVRFSSAVILVEDIGVSRKFYEGLLDQTVMMDHGENVLYAGGLSLWEVKKAYRIIFDREATGKTRLGRDNFEVYFESGDVEAVYGRFVDAGIETLQPVHEEPWGQRTFRCYDPDGHLVEVAEPMDALARRLSGEGMTPVEISRRTTMPMEFVLQAIGHPRFC